MADYSSAAQIAAIAAPLAAVIMTVIKVRGLSTTARPGGMYTGDRNDRGLTTVVCPDHSGLVAELRNLKNGQDRIEQQMHENFAAVFSRFDQARDDK